MSTLLYKSVIYIHCNSTDHVVNLYMHVNISMLGVHVLFLGGQRFVFVGYGFVLVGYRLVLLSMGMSLCWVWVCFGQVAFFPQIYLLLGRPTYVLFGYIRFVLVGYVLALVRCCCFFGVGVKFAFCWVWV